MSNAETPTLTDSPWFWVLMFSLVALLALGVIAGSGRYGRRQATLERQYQARQRVAEKLVERDHYGNPVPVNKTPRIPRTQDDVVPLPYATPENTLLPLWPLAALLVMIAAAAGLILRREYHRSVSLANKSSP
jgi:hypothetical protein